MIQLSTKVNIIQVYTPTIEKLDNDMESFNDDQDNILKFTKTQDVTVVILMQRWQRIDFMNAKGDMVW